MIGFGDVIALSQVFWHTLRHPSSKALFWSVRRRFSAKRLRQQMKLFHRGVTHVSRDTVSRALEMFSECQEQNDAINQEIFALELSGTVDPGALNGLMTQLGMQEEYLSRLIVDIQRESTSFMDEICTGLSEFLSRWMPDKCRVAIYTLHGEDTVVDSRDYKRFSEIGYYQDNPGRLFEEIGGKLNRNFVGMPQVVAWARARCLGSRQDRRGIPPWKLVTSTTPFDCILRAPRGDLKGNSVLFQSAWVDRKRRGEAETYRDPSRERQQYQSVVCVPLRGEVLATAPGDWGFLWLDCAKPHAFERMFQHHPIDDDWTAGLHLLLGIADAVANVLAIERFIQQAIEREARELGRLKGRIDPGS